MEIILLERVEKLGSIGDVVTVKDGYARNYLLPNKKALRANEANRKVFEANRARIEADNAERRTDATLYRRLATLRTDVPLAEDQADLRWQGADRQALEALATEWGDPGLVERIGTFQK